MQRIIFVKLDLNRDMWNWWDACNRKSHGVDWKMRIEPKLRNKIVGKNQKEVYKFLKPYLTTIYRENQYFKDHIDRTQSGFDSKQDEIFKTMEQITKHPICHKEIICFLTTFPRFPYNFGKGYIWLSSKKPFDYQVSIFIHELLHFQFMAYYGERVWNEIGEEKYQCLKEGMTIILNDEFADLTKEKDEGYLIYRDFSQKLLRLWREKRDFDFLIEKGTQILKRP